MLKFAIGLAMTCAVAATPLAASQAQIVLKATKVDGVYTADPATNPDAQLLKRITFKEPTPSVR